MPKMIVIVKRLFFLLNIINGKKQEGWLLTVYGIFYT